MTGRTRGTRTPKSDPQRGFSENRRVGRSGEKIGFCIATSFLGGNKLGFRALGAYLTLYFGRGREGGEYAKSKQLGGGNQSRLTTAVPELFFAGKQKNKEQTQRGGSGV